MPVAEWMCRWVAEKNYGLTLGEFKLDTSDGEISFRITCPLDKGAVNEDIVTVAYSNALSTFDKAYEEIIKAIYLDNGRGEDGLTNLAMETVRRKLENHDSVSMETKQLYS